MNSYDAVTHKGQLPGMPVCTEYFLPQPEIPDNLRGNMTPWMISIASSTTPELKRIIDERFAQIEQPELQPLCRQLSAYVARSVVACEDNRGFLRLDSHHASKGAGSSAYIPSPPDADRVRSKLASTGFSSNAIFSAFALSFCGLAEDYMVSGHFLRDDADWQLLNEDWQKDLIDNFSEWQGSLLFYYARNGDTLLLHPKGHVGWCKFAEGHVERQCDSFSAFIQYYVKYRADNAWPFDSYGP
jgi:hypothetical protein